MKMKMKMKVKTLFLKSQDDPFFLRCSCDPFRKGRTDSVCTSPTCCLKCTALFTSSKAMVNFRGSFYMYNPSTILHANSAVFAFFPGEFFHSVRSVIF